ncbi:hypothetical protein ALC56_11920 [Trachymyrmex septentrionalis]|uniref:Uncharacterized protein n=1 Tax=Trachymyrmex septentrionalis TaxID=34720 RepID=A0A195EZM0_9HYME|nr:hypothetical protein ALC56_11920 [Trachymyrmex septentrionalis]
MSWTATRGGKRSNGDGTVNKATELPFLGSMAVKAARWFLAVKTSQVFRGYQLFSRASPKLNARGSFPTAFASCIDQNITPSAFARVVRIGQNYRTEGDQVDADNDSTRWTAMSSSPGTYAADFYDPSIPLSPGLHVPPKYHERHCTKAYRKHKQQIATALGAINVHLTNGCSYLRITNAASVTSSAQVACSDFYGGFARIGLMLQ